LSIKRLQKQLAREIKAKPKHAVALALALLAAGYFWAPLLVGTGSTKKSSKPMEQSAQAQQSQTNSPKKSAAKDATTEVAKAPDIHINWRNLDSLFRSESLLNAFSQLAPSKDPFRSESFEKHEKVELQTPAEPVTKEQTPAELGMTLTSTVIGGRRPTALIDGRSYTTGQYIEKTDGAIKLTFLLKEIHPRRVVLERNKRQFEIDLSQPAINKVVIHKALEQTD